MVPFALVGGLAIAVLLTHRVGNVAAQSSPRQLEEVAAPRSAATMLAREPLHSLLVEEDKVEAERKRYLALLEASHRGEPIEAQWATKAEHRLIEAAHGQALVATGITPQAWSMQCRSRSCKVSAIFGDYGDAMDWANFFLTGTGDTLAQAELSVTRGANDTTDVLIFGARR